MEQGAAFNPQVAKTGAQVAAKEIFVLLENNVILPLQKDAVSIREGVTSYGANAVFAKGCDALEPGAVLPGMNFIPACNESKSCLHDLGECREGQYPAPWGASIFMPRCLRRGY